MSQTLRWRLAIPYVVLVILTMIGLNLYLIAFIRNSYLDSLKTSLAADARIIADATAAYLVGYTDQPSVYNVVRRYASRLDMRVTIIYPDGTVLADSEANPAEMDNHLTRPEVKAAAAGNEASEIRYSTTLRKNLLYLAIPIRSGNQLVGIARVARPLEQIDAYLSELRRTLLAVTLVAIAFTITISMLLTGYTIRPLQELTEATRRITSGDLNPKSLPVARDEIGQLNLAFNQMAVQLRTQIEALRAEQGKLGAVLAHMTDGVIIADREGRVQLINPAAARMFAISEEASAGRSLAEVIRHYQLVELWRSSQGNGKQQQTTLELPADRLFLQSIATPLSPAIPGSTLLLFQDLTRLHRLETVRQDFVSNVSHELRTPLASLKALTETLQEGALEDPPAARRFLSRMETEIDTLTQMVRELLELARIESGKVPLQRKSLLPQDLIGPAVERMHLQAERAGLTLKVDCPRSSTKRRRRPRTPGAGVRQPPAQCHQVHTAWGRDPGIRLRRRQPGSIPGARHGGRDRRQGPHPDFRAFLQGRPGPVGGRHRARAVHFPPPHRGSRRQDLGGKRPGSGQQLLFFPAVRSQVNPKSGSLGPALPSVMNHTFHERQSRSQRARKVVNLLFTNSSKSLNIAALPWRVYHGILI